MEQKKIRLLRPDEIECRIGTISEKGLSLLLFMDARAAQNILDESFTSFGWRRTHQEIGGRLYCTVEVWDGEKSSGSTSRTWERKALRKRRKGRLLIPLSGPVLTGGLDGNFTPHRLSGFRQTE